jgi:endogenous inhibitor of DNA gyrase (YacG/DUF329 family)
MAGRIGGMGDVALCVYCRRRPIDPAYRPFCSGRCKLQDLARWAGGSYRIAGEPPASDPDDPDDLDNAEPHTEH